MAKVTLKKNFADGQVLHGADLNLTNEQVELAINTNMDILSDLLDDAALILPAANEYTDEQVADAISGFSTNPALLRVVTDLTNNIQEVSSIFNDSFDAINNFTNKAYVNDKAILSPQVDGKIENYFSSTDPNTWGYLEFAQHNGDKWYNTSTGNLKQYASVTNTWVAITDLPTINAYKNMSYSGVESINVFTTTPTTPYNLKDLWSGGSSGDLKRCINPRATGSYDAADWELMTGYMNDSELVSFIDNEYADFVDATDGIVGLWYGGNDPSIDWNTDAKRELHVGDLWRDKDSDLTYIYTEDFTWAVDNVPSSVFDQIDGKRSIFTSQPTIYRKNDAYIVEAGALDLPDTINVGDILFADVNSIVFSWDHWSKKDGYVGNVLFNNTIEPITTDLTTVINDMDMNIPTSKLGQIVTTLSDITDVFKIKGGSNLIPNSLQIVDEIISNTLKFDRTENCWEARENQEIAQTTVSDFMTYCTIPGFARWTIKTIPNTAYSLHILYNSAANEVSTLKITNGIQETLINSTTKKVLEEYNYGFIATGNYVDLELECSGTGFSYSDFIMNFGVLDINSVPITPNNLVWQPAHGENFGTAIRFSYEGAEFTSEQSKIRQIIDHTGNRIVDTDTNEIVTSFDNSGLTTKKATIEGETNIGSFTFLPLDTENLIIF